MTDSASLESNHNRWRLNKQGQLVDTDVASADWDIADEIVRLKIADVVGEAVPLADSSPLETASSITSSPNQISVSHSRESSGDISGSGSQESHALPVETVLQSPFKAGSVSEVKERPHSFSGGLSSADLRRLQQAGGPDITDHLQQQQWMATSDGVEQPSYPSLANTVHRPHQAFSDYRSSGQPMTNSPSRDDLMQQIDFNIQQRASMSPATATATGQGLPFGQGRSGSIPSPLYRQPPRAFPQPQNVIPSPTAMAYPPAPHLPLGNTQQLYDMMLPPHESMNPAVNRVQQQHNVFRGGHHHSTSDPSALRDATAMALLNGNMQFNPAMFTAGIAAPPPGMPIYANQFYRAQDAYRPDPAAMAAARLQAQYTGPYGMVAPPIDPAMGSPTNPNTPGLNGPSANNRKLGLYKTELCRSWEEKGSCRYGAKCQFAHGEEELRSVSRHPKYKTEICRTFWVSGSCPYGKRCCFIHTELPTSANAAAASASGSDTATPPAHTDGRARSMSTNSDPNDGSVSLLARISAKRSQESSTNTSTPVESPSSFQFTRPPTGTLRVDTSTLDTSLKQNKSAYPTFARNGVLLPAPEDIKAKSPAPVTAGPDLGRHNSSRLEIVGYNQRVKTTTPPSTNSRNSIGGADEMNFSSSPVPGGSGHSYTLSSGDGTNTTQTRANGHVRAGSAGNWASITRNNPLTSSSFPSPGGDTITSPWSTTELAVGSSRFSDKAWA